MSKLTTRVAVVGAGAAVIGGVLAAGVVSSDPTPSNSASLPGKIVPVHGWVGSSQSDVTARVAMKSNTNLGSISYEPQSLEAPKGFPAAGPADGQIASAGVSIAKNLDEQTSTRWVKNNIAAGPIKFGWTFTAPHNTSKWHYYITKNGWDQNAPLKRDALQPIGTVTHDGSAASTNPVHTLNVPADHKGYHVILAVWDVADTANAFYNVVDVNVGGGSGGGTTTPPTTTPPTTTPPTTTPPTTTPGSDVTKPSAPSAVHSMGTTASSVDLMWTESTDNVGVDRYEIKRGVKGQALSKVGSTAKTSHLDSGLAASTTYQYQVVAFDKAGNSASSSVFEVTTRSGTTTTPPATGVAEWNPRGSYKVGDKVTYQGSTYQALQAHTGNGDPNWIYAPSLWKKVS